MSVEENKKVARMYHALRPEDIDKILTPDFIGRHRPESGFTWNREQHKAHVTENPSRKHRIHELIAEGDRVATRFEATGTFSGKPVRVDMMHFMRFEAGKIAEIWEYFDSKQLPEQ